uniref:FYVE-type domain-containing protein n=1 Tax=Globodera rostochiensis TaxID=31243 RepID=A0A914HAF7_GLORO
MQIVKTGTKNGTFIFQKKQNANLKKSTRLVLSSTFWGPLQTKEYFEIILHLVSYMCDFGRSLSSNAVPMDNTTLPDMDELLDRLEREPPSMVGLQPQFSSMAAVCPIRHEPVAIKELQNDDRNVENGTLTDRSDKELINSNADEEFKSNKNRIIMLASDANDTEAEGQIGVDQRPVSTPPTLPHNLWQKIQNERIIGQLHEEQCPSVFKSGNDDSTGEDIYDQIDRMAAQINAEELDHKAENEPRKDFADQFITLANNKCLDSYVEAMVESILAQIMTEQIHQATTNGTGKDENELSQIVEEEKLTDKEGERREKANVAEEAERVTGEPILEPFSAASSSAPSPADPQQTNHSPIKDQRRNRPLATVHDLSAALDEFKLTESELQLGKKRPFWIPDEDCLDCMLCSTRFSIVNRRHHCRACGRVLCRVCCTQRRQLAYMEEKEGKQRVCVPCNRTLDRIEEYEQRMASAKPRNAYGDDDENGQVFASDATRQRTQQKNEVAEQSHRQSVEESGTSRPKKKSLLKQPPFLAGDSAVAIDPRQAAEVGPSGSNASQTTEGKQPASSLTVAGAVGKRSVTFRDGVNPGHDSGPNSANSSTNALNCAATESVASSSPYRWLISGSDRSTSNGDSSAKMPSVQTTGNDVSVPSDNNKKLPRKMSRRSRDRRMEEEGQCLLLPKNDGNIDQQQRTCRIWLVERRIDGIEELVQRDLADVGLTVSEEDKNCKDWTVALRRNFHLRIERKKIRDDDGLPTLAVSTRGLATIGVDELFLAFQYDPKSFAEKAELKWELLALLQQFDLIFQHCLDAQDDSSVDHQMGIRKCISRMAQLYPLLRKGRPLFGHKAASILFQRPHPKQSFADFHPPPGPFLVGVFVQEEEVPWAMCVPCRVLLRLGMLSGEYPFPVVNVRREQPLFTTGAVQASVLKVLNDFRHWSYRMARLCGCSVAIRDMCTDVILSPWALDEVRQIVATNRNMIGWALSELCAMADTEEDSTEVDSHLVCVQEEGDDGGASFVTRIFSRNDSAVDATELTTRKVTGASFVIFDGALRGSERLLVSLVEDGLVVRLHADLMEELVKALMAGDSFSATNEQGHRFSVSFHCQDGPSSPNVDGWHKSSSSSISKWIPGVLQSPIDGRPLDGHVQYGLDRSRLLRSLIFFQFSSEWALRLSAVINMLPGKFPSALQPRFFDLCEQLTTQIVPTLEPFLQELISAEQRSISLRVHVDGEAISYETEKWPALPEQHFVWTVTLDEQLIPFLYALCTWLPSVFFVELHTFIVSARPLPALSVPDNSSNL